MAVRARNNYLSEAQLEVMKSFDAGWKGYVPKYQEVFNVENDPSRLTEKFSVRGGMTSAFTPVADGAPYNDQNPKIVGTQTISELIFKEQVALTKMMKTKDNYRSAIEDANQLGYLSRLKMDKLGADLLNLCTTTTVTWDGLALLHASHLIGDTGATQSNTTSGGLTTSNLETAIQNFSLQKSHNGSVMGLMPKYIIVPTRNMMLTKKLIGSPMTPEDANTSINAVTESGLIPIYWPQLVTTNFEAMLLSDKAMHRLEYLIHYGPDLTPARDSDTGNDLVQLDLACNAGAVDYLGTYFITV
jgi:hypothetical protein